jgi:peptidoglycan/xylan/chitin deacetylase (PgdA/CDA1 family)
MKKPGATQTASVRSPYIYAEDNWTDDMELATAAIHSMLINRSDSSGANGFYMLQALKYAQMERITPWLGDDTAKHYQWYPFINLGHYELAKELKSNKHGPRAGYYEKFMKEVWNYADSVTGYYRQGIQRVWNKAGSNAFYRGIPFIWCSNNLTVAFAIQCRWYKELTGDKTFDELEQANFDWLFGCNPWGTSMVYGLPSWGDTPVDPHSAFTHLKNYPIDGGLVDGPVYGSIYNGLIGIQLKDPDEYANLQSNLAVYHDDYGDYSTNEPTMDGTASLIYLLAAKEAESKAADKFTYSHGGIIRGDSTKKNIALVFTGDEFADGGDLIAQVLKQEQVKASFFFTGNFYYDVKKEKLINRLVKDQHFLGNHSFKHLLYCDWTKRDSLLVTQGEFMEDLFGLTERLAHLRDDNGTSSLTQNEYYFLPPYEWYNDTISAWSKEFGKQLINFTPGTLGTADYTTPEMKNYRSSETIYNSIINYEKSKPSGLNGFLLLLHIGTDPKRTDKFYKRLPELIKYCKSKGYKFQTVDQLLKR